MSPDPHAARSLYTRSRTNKTAQRFCSFRWGAAEFLLCVIAPCLALFVWMHWDRELRSALLANWESDHVQQAASVYDMVTIDDESILSVSAQGQVQFWDVSQSICLGEMQSHLAEVHCAAYSPQNRLLALGSMWGQLEIWDLEHPDQPMATSEADTLACVEACKFTPDGSLLCSGGDMGEIQIRDARTLQLLHTLRNPETGMPIRSLEITRDGKYLLTGNKRGTVNVWELATWSLLHTLRVASSVDPSVVTIPDSIIEAILILPDDRECVIVTRSCGISVWNLASGTCLRHWKNTGPALHSATLSGDGNRVLTGNAAGEIWTWETATGQFLRSVAVHSDYVRSLETNRDGSFAISSDARGKIKGR